MMPGARLALGAVSLGLLVVACGARPTPPPPSQPVACDAVPVASGAPAGAVVFADGENVGVAWLDGETLTVRAAGYERVVRVAESAPVRLVAAAARGEVVTVALQPPHRNGVSLLDVGDGRVVTRDALALDDRTGRSVHVAGDGYGATSVFAARVGDEPRILLARDDATAWFGVEAPGSFTAPAVDVGTSGTAAVAWLVRHDGLVSLHALRWVDDALPSDAASLASLTDEGWFGTPVVWHEDGEFAIAFVQRLDGHLVLHVWRDGVLSSRPAPSWLSASAPRIVSLGDTAWIADTDDDILRIADLDQLRERGRADVDRDMRLRTAGDAFVIDGDDTTLRITCPMFPATPVR